MQILPWFSALPLAPPLPLLPGLSNPEQRQVANGAQVMVLAMEASPLVCIDFWCRAGSVFEGPGESGLAHFLEHMVFKGSRNLAAG